MQSYTEMHNATLELNKCSIYFFTNRHVTLLAPRTRPTTNQIIIIIIIIIKIFNVA